MSMHERKFEAIKDRKFGKITVKKGVIYTEIQLFGATIKEKTSRNFELRGRVEPIISYKMTVTQFLKYFKEVENG